MLSIKQAAAFMGVSASKLYGLVAERKVASYRIGGKIVLAQADIDTFLASCRVGAVTAKVAAPRVQVKLKHLRLN